MLDREIVVHQDEILERWIDEVFNGYPEETARFLRSNPDRFSNPVGAGLREGLKVLLDGVLSGVGPEELEADLDRILRVRAVQEFEPSIAVGFVFGLKDLLRRFAGEDADDSFEILDRRIERLGMCAFDVYMRCREQMWQIRAREIRNQSVGIMERVAEWRKRRDKSSEDVPQT